MASLPSTIFPYSALLVSLFLLVQPRLYVDARKVASHHVISVQSLLPGDVCSPSNKGFNGTSLTVVHRHGPCSPFGRRQSQPGDHEELLAQDQARVDWLHRHESSAAAQPDRIHNPLAGSKIPDHTGGSLGTGNYVVTVAFGTPRRYQSVVFDTGSDVTWIQCQPCAAYCYPQQDPLFDPAHSSTYANISCSSPYCAALTQSGCTASTCLYAVQYGDDSYTVGFFAEETLTLTPADVVPGFRFGCGEKNSGLFGRAAGLLGLGRGAVSLVTQTSPKYGGVFSYCLPSSSSATGYLSFGRAAAPAGLQYTPMASGSAPTFYYLELLAISVGGQQLPVPATVFSRAGVLLDSGTVITRLPPTAYSALSSAFRKLMSGYPSAPAYSILDTCYDLSAYKTVQVPTVALQFRGASVRVDATGTLYQVKASQVCLAFAANGDDGDTAIIGNTQQRSLNVVYDVANKQIGFGPGGC